jgi:hypothetical protein
MRITINCFSRHLADNLHRQRMLQRSPHFDIEPQSKTKLEPTQAKTRRVMLQWCHLSELKTTPNESHICFTNLHSTRQCRLAAIRNARTSIKLWKSESNCQKNRSGFGPPREVMLGFKMKARLWLNNNQQCFALEVGFGGFVSPFAANLRASRRQAHCKVAKRIQQKLQMKHHDAEGNR